MPQKLPFFRCLSALAIILFLTVLTPQIMAQTRMGFVVDRAPTRLEESRLRLCRIRETMIGKRMDRLEAFVDNMVAKFDAIAARVKTYYATKGQEKGITVPDYDQLVAAIDTEKIAVRTAFNEAKSVGDAFTCEGNNPAETLRTYHGNMRAVKDALQAYRTAVRNLIVAVHSAAQAGEEAP